jgi:hypothetical protein
MVWSALPLRPLTVLDYIRAVYPWVYRYKADIVRAYIVWKTGKIIPPDIEIYLLPSTTVYIIYIKVSESINPAT